MKVNLNNIEDNYIVDEEIAGTDFDLHPGDVVTVYEVLPEVDRSILGEQDVTGLLLQVVSFGETACAADKELLKVAPACWIGWFAMGFDGTILSL